MMVPTIVDSEYFPTSDSSNVWLIVKFNHQGIIVSDTTYTIYSRGMYFPGDSLRIDADLLGVTIDMSKTEGVMETQKVIYFLGAGALFFAFIFFLVSTRVKTVIK